MNDFNTIRKSEQEGMLIPKELRDIEAILKLLKENDEREDLCVDLLYCREHGLIYKPKEKRSDMNE